MSVIGTETTQPCTATKANLHLGRDERVLNSVCVCVCVFVGVGVYWGVRVLSVCFVDGE